MATLANLVKNIDPPVEITQADYAALPAEQKQDGTEYYITDGSGSFQIAATTPAEASDGTGSNVQVELDKRLEVSKLVNGGTATAAGYALDARFGKTLNDQVNQLTDRITELSWKSVPTTAVTSLSDFCNYIDEQIATNGTLVGYLNAEVSQSIGLPNNGHFLQVYSNSTNYRICITYSTGGIKINTLVKAGGIWQSLWHTVTLSPLS